MLSQLQTHKLTHLFNILDFDSNGHIQEEDFEAIGENLAIVRDFEFDSPEFDSLTGLTKGIWTNLVPFVDGGGVNLSDWLSFLGKILDEENGDVYYRYVTQFVETLFDLFDENNDGVISQTEYIDLFIGLRIEVRFAPKAFRKLDINGDGIISKDELIKSVDEFMKSDDPNSTGNWLFGAWE